MSQALRRSIFVIPLAVLFFAGCSGESKKRPPMAKVSGKVSYKGKPVTDASVTFIMEGSPRVATGQTDASGNFKLTTFDTNDGAFIGTHKVTVVKIASVAGNKAPEALKPEDLAKMSKDGSLQKSLKTEGIPQKYADVKTTTLKYTIEPGSNEKAIELED